MLYDSMKFLKQANKQWQLKERLPASGEVGMKRHYFMGTIPVWHARKALKLERWLCNAMNVLNATEE